MGPPLADRAADQDRVVWSLDARLVLDHHAGQANVGDVVLAAGIRAAADLDVELAERLAVDARLGEVLRIRSPTPIERVTARLQ